MQDRQKMTAYNNGGTEEEAYTDIDDKAMAEEEATGIFILTTVFLGDEGGKSVGHADANHHEDGKYAGPQRYGGEGDIAGVTDDDGVGQGDQGMA
jgi:hypothetical protein